MSSDRLSRSASTRFGDRVKGMKLPTLRRARTTIQPPPRIEETLAETSDSSGADSALTIPKSSSFSSLVTRSPSPESRRTLRPKSECYNPKRLSGLSLSSDLASSSPLAPRILSVQDNQWVHQSLLLVFGQLGEEERLCGQVTVYHHLESYPPTKWPLCDGFFKALVRLEPGPNKLRFSYSSSKHPSTSFSSALTVNMLPLIAAPPLHLALVLAKDSLGEHEDDSERKKSEGNGIDVAIKKLRMAGYLCQAFTGESLWRARLGRRCFRLEEEWTTDTLSCGPRVVRNTAKVHVIRVDATVEEIRRFEAASNGAELRRIVSDAVNTYFMPSHTSRRYVAALVLDSKGDLQIPGNTSQSSFTSGLGIVGSQSMCTLPSCVEEVVPSFSDCTRTATNNRRFPPAGPGSQFLWEGATAVLGTMLEAFLSPQVEVEARSFMRINRTFVTKEPYSLRNGSPGPRVSLPEDENIWPRVDCLRFRYHPCFRLPTDPAPTAIPDIPQAYAIERGIVASASTGIALVLLYCGDTYSSYIEYTTRPEREVILHEDLVRGKIRSMNRGAPIKLRIFSAGLGETIVGNYWEAKSQKVQLSNGFGSAFRSTPSGAGRPPGSSENQAQELVLHSTTTGRMLTSVRVFHNKLSLEGLEFLYEDASSQFFGSRATGDGSDSSISDFQLDARKGETLMGFCIRLGDIIDGIEILTSFGRRSACYGNPDGGSR